MGRYQKGKTNLDFSEARDSEWQWHQLGHMQVCTSLQADNHASTPPLSFFTGRMPSLPPNQQRQSTEGTVVVSLYWIFCCCEGCDLSAQQCKLETVGRRAGGSWRGPVGTQCHREEISAEYQRQDCGTARTHCGQRLQGLCRLRCLLSILICSDSVYWV